MKEIITTELIKDQDTVKKELVKIIHTMIISRFFKQIYSIEEILLIYVPFCITEFEVSNIGRTKKARRFNHIFVSTDVSSGRMIPLMEADVLELENKEIDEEQISIVKPDMEAIDKAARKELLFNVLPKNLRAWKEYDLDTIEAKVFYRPTWLVRYKLFGKYRVYKTFGDKYNL